MPSNNSTTLREILKQHKTLIVVGGNWGDEGKGKVIDLIMEHFDIVTRFSGGSNAGHTVFTPDGRKLVSHQIPCGLAQSKICVMGRGEFFNLKLFLEELEDTKKVLGETLAPIYIDRQAPLWTPYHSLFEAYIEATRGERKIGTTNKGIGPLEGIYKLRLSPMVGLLFDENLLKNSITALYKVLEPALKALKEIDPGTHIPSIDEVTAELIALSGGIKDFVIDTSFLLDESLKQAKRILFEGAQATGLDAWWGTYPFVSSGNSVAVGAALGTGLPMQNFDAAVLVAKTLPTRVGNGPFPSEMWERQAAMAFAKERLDLFSKGEGRDQFLSSTLQKINDGVASPAEMSQYFQVLGDERGATTGRGRSVGYLDIPWLQYAIRVNGPKYIALTRFDMLSGIKSIPVVVGYRYKGQDLKPGQLPAAWELGEVEAVKEDWLCFAENIAGISDPDKLPASAKEFLSKLEKNLGVQILLVGTGPGREAMVVRS